MRAELNLIRDNTADDEFLMSNMERRVNDRREQGSEHKDYASPLAIMASKISKLEEEMDEVKSHIKRNNAKNDEILEKITDIRINQEKQKSFFAGVVWLVGGIFGLISLVFPHFKQ